MANRCSGCNWCVRSPWSGVEFIPHALADLGFLEGVTLRTRASIEGVRAYGRIKFERL